MIFLGPEDTQGTWSACQKSHEAATRVEGAPPTLWPPRESSDLLLGPIYIFTYIPKPSEPSAKILFYLRNLLFL